MPQYLYDNYWVGESGQEQYLGTTWVNSGTITEKQYHNVTNIYFYMLSRGWTHQAVCGMLGNAMLESKGFNPLATETGRKLIDDTDANSYTRGIGLVQWTSSGAPPQKLVQWALNNSLDWRSGNVQCQRMIVDIDDQFEPVRIDGINFTWETYISFTGSVSTATKAFLYGYERASDPNVERRIDNGLYWDQWFTLHPTRPIPKWLLFANKKKRGVKYVKFL